MYLGRTTTTTGVRALIGMVQYYRDMWPRRSHVISPLAQAASNPKDRATILNDDLEVAFHKINHMVSAETLLNYHDWAIHFNVNMDSSDKQLGAVISTKL